MRIALAAIVAVGVASLVGCRGSGDRRAAAPPRPDASPADPRVAGGPAPASVLPVPASEAAGHGAAAAEAGGTCPLASAAPSAAARVGATWHEGATGYDVARREQGATRAPMVVYFRTDWCGYCRRFEGGLLDRPATQAYLGARAVKVRVNPETGPREAALAERFGVEGFPTFLVVAGDAPEEISPFVDEGLRIRVLTPGEFEAAVEGVIAARVKAGLARSEALLGGGDPAAAVALLDDLIGLDPRRAETYFRRGLAHGALRARERAFADFRRAVELKPDFPEVYRSTDQWLARDGRWDEIIDCWSDYLGRAPRSAAGYLERGDAYRRKGDRDRARADAETACQLGESRGCDAARRL